MPVLLASDAEWQKVLTMMTAHGRAVLRREELAFVSDHMSGPLLVCFLKKRFNCLIFFEM